MPRLNFRPRAATDLRQIGRYTQRAWGIAQRRIYVEHLYRRCEQVAARPHLGRPRDDIRSGCRSIRAGRHLIFHRETADGIEVIRILHEAMDIRGRFDDA